MNNTHKGLGFKTSVL